jgi:hypothetical protein
MNDLHHSSDRDDRDKPGHDSDGLTLHPKQSG